MTFELNFYSTLTEIYLILGINILIIFGALTSMAQKKGYPLVNLIVGFLSFQIIIISFFLICSDPFENLFTWNHFLVSDFFTFGAKLLLIMCYIVWFLTTLHNIEVEKINSFEYWILSILALLAMFFTLQAFDLLSVYLCIEFQSLNFYILASFKRTSEFSTEAGLKYFILGAFSSALLLFGSALLYALTGLSNLGDFSKFFIDLPQDEIIVFFGTITSLVFIGVALFFKLTVAPFHMWAPDVYEGSPITITMFFSLLPKLVILSLILRIFTFSFYDLFLVWKKTILFGALLSILVGSLGALSQRKWKRFLAYSSITHIGFMLIGLSTGELEGITSMLFYNIVYMITTLLIFSFLVSFRIVEYPYHNQIRYLKDISFLSLVNPTLALTLTLTLFSMAGIPPLAGFFAKVFIIFAGLQNNLHGAILFSIIMSCIACFYYIRIIKQVYFDNSFLLSVFYPIDKNNSLILSFSIFFISFLFLDIEFVSLCITRMSIPFLG